MLKTIPKLQNRTANGLHVTLDSNDSLVKEVERVIVCVKCKRLLEANKFYPSILREQPKSPWCKECHDKRRKENAKAFRERGILEVAEQIAENMREEQAEQAEQAALAQHLLPRVVVAEPAPVSRIPPHTGHTDPLLAILGLAISELDVDQRRQLARMMAAYDG